MAKRTKIEIILSIVVTLILLIGGTYAAWNFLSEKTSITMTVDGDQITFDAGEAITVEGILPVYTMEEGITKDIVVYKENGEYEAGINLYLNLATWPSAMSSASFRWALYKNGDYLNSGSFANTSKGNNIKLTSNTQYLNLEENKDSYKLYMWIDAYQESSINMMNQTFTVNLYGQATFYRDSIDEEQAVSNVEPNAPELADGMIPIKYNYVIDEWVKADSTNANDDWYDYYNKRWANAVMVTSDTREMYMNADVGTTIHSGDVLAYYVWIPRYRYILFNTNFASISAVEIQVEFQGVNDEINTGTTNGQFLTHPAFWWDNDSDGVRESGEELAGFWVGKFETYGTSAVKTNILPNNYSQESKNIYNWFLETKKFESTDYLTETGVASVDIHMMKNMEWGDVAYLTRSRYGINGSVKNNTTGYSGRYSNYTYNDFVILNGVITIDKEAGTGTLASTTGNVYGIYDMSGNYFEYVMAFMKNSDGTIFYSNSGFSDSNIVDSKYYDLYEYGIEKSDVTRSKLGDALGEVRGFNTGFVMITISSGCFHRGGYYSTSVSELLVSSTGYCAAKAFDGNVAGTQSRSRAVIVFP